MEMSGILISMETTAAFLRTHFYTRTLPHLDPEQQAQYNHLRTQLFDDIEPQNAIEHEYFEQLVHASWQLDRVRQLEDHALFQLSSDPDNKQFRRDYANFQRCRRNLDRTVATCLKELRRLVTTRVLAVAVNANTSVTTETNAPVPALLDLQQVLPQGATRPHRDVLSLSLAKLKNPKATYRAAA